VKSDLFDNKLRLNVAGFFFNYDDIVLLATFCADLPPGQQVPCLRPTNVGSADVKGVEIELSFHPTDSFSMDASLSELDFEYKYIDPTSGTGVSIDGITPFTPERKASIGAQYDFDNVASGTLSFRVDASYQSEIFTEAGNVRSQAVSSTNPRVAPYSQAGGGGPITTLYADNHIDGYTLANARISWNQDAEEGWGVALEVLNLFDKYYLGNKVNDSYSVGHVYGTPGKPRTWGITVKKKF
jgi:iron complex outermembrane receptor protein